MSIGSIRRRIVELETTAAAYARANVALSLHARTIYDAADAERRCHQQQTREAEVAAATAIAAAVAAVAVTTTLPVSADIAESACVSAVTSSCAAIQTESPAPAIRVSVGTITVRDTSDAATQSAPTKAPSDAVFEEGKSESVGTSASSSALHSRIRFADNAVSRLTCELSVAQCEVARLTATIQNERRGAANARAAAEGASTEAAAARSALAQSEDALRRVGECEAAVKSALATAAKYREKYAETRARLIDETFRYDETAAALALANKQIAILNATAASAVAADGAAVREGVASADAVKRVGAILSSLTAADESNATSLSCALCYALLDDAVAMSKCGHIGCRACISADDKCAVCGDDDDGVIELPMIAALVSHLHFRRSALADADIHLRNNKR